MIEDMKKDKDQKTSSSKRKDVLTATPSSDQSFEESDPEEFSKGDSHWIFDMLEDLMFRSPKK